MTLIRKSPCKVNLLLNILGRRPDGFHELETVMQPVNLCDELAFERTASGVQLTCSEPSLPTDAGNLVHRAATAFLERGGITAGVRIHLDKKIPMAAGLGGGSGNAATTLLALNDLFERPLAAEALQEIAARLGSDIPFFLQSNPAVAVDPKQARASPRTTSFSRYRAKSSCTYFSKISNSLGSSATCSQGSNKRDPFEQDLQRPVRRTTWPSCAPCEPRLRGASRLAARFAASSTPPSRS